MSLQATQDKVVIRPDDIEEATDSGLILAPNFKDNPTTGVIVSIGSPDRHSMEGIEVGDRVCFRDLAGAAATWEGQEYYILTYDEILAVLPPEES